MKAILEFDLPEDADEHRLALDGGKWASAMHALDQDLRTRVKHGEDRAVLPSEVRKMLYDTLSEYGLSFDE